MRDDMVQFQAAGGTPFVGRRLRVDARPADPENGVRLLALDGMLDVESAPDFERALAAEVSREVAPRVVVDFARVPFVSSAGWGVLVGLAKRTRDKRGELRVSGLTEVVAQGFRLLGLERHFRSFATWTAAVDEPWGPKTQTV